MSGIIKCTLNLSTCVFAENVKCWQIPSDKSCVKRVVFNIIKLRKSLCKELLEDIGEWKVWLSEIKTHLSDL